MRLRQLIAAIAWLTTSLAAGSQPTAVCDSRLPSVIVDAREHQITNRQRRLVSITLTSTDSTQHSRAEMSIRGSSSAKHPKKPYRLELQDENGDDLKLSLLGMPKESDWILYPAYLDKTMIRDVLAYELWRQMGYWAPRTRYVHLFIHTNSSSSSSSSSSSFSLSNSVSSVFSVADSSSLPSFAFVENFGSQTNFVASVLNPPSRSSRASVEYSPLRVKPTLLS
jgi:hypothetical protein